MFLRDDYKFEDELKTLNSVEEAIREARRYRRIFYGMLWGSVLLWVGLMILIDPRGAGSVSASMFFLLAIFYCQLLRIDSRIKALLLRRQLFRESEQQQNAKG